MSDEKKGGSSGAKYYFAPAFERAMVTMACRSERFWSRIGAHVDPALVNIPESVLALEACKAIAHETGRGPASIALVMQRLHRGLDDGRLPIEKIQQVAAFFEKALEDGLPNEDQTTAELAAILGRRMRQAAALQAIEDSKKSDGDFSKTQSIIERARTLGDTNTDVGVLLGAGSTAEINKIKGIDRLSTGSMELDEALVGGLFRGCLGLVVGGTGSGKSMMLGQIAAYSVKLGLFVAYATLELPRPHILARLKACILGVPIDGVMADPDAAAAHLASMKLGPFVVQAFTPKMTTMADLEAWVHECEQHVGRKIDLLVTDYGDKLVAPATKKSKGGDENTYVSGEIVFERMRIYADERQIWHWSAAQARRSADKKKRMLDVEDVADSMNKVRVADLVLTVNRDEEQNEVSVFVAKNRYGKDALKVGPLPTDLSVGRLVPMIMEMDPGVSSGEAIDNFLGAHAAEMLAKEE